MAAGPGSLSRAFHHFAPPQTLEILLPDRSSTTAGLTAGLLWSGRPCPQHDPTSAGDASRGPAGRQPLPAPPSPPPWKVAARSHYAWSRPASARGSSREARSGTPAEFEADGAGAAAVAGGLGGRVGPPARCAPAAGRSGLAAVGPGAAVRRTGPALHSGSPARGSRCVTGLFLCSHGSKKEASANQRSLSAGPEASPEPRETCCGSEEHLQSGTRL